MWKIRKLGRTGWVDEERSETRNSIWFTIRSTLYIRGIILRTTFSSEEGIKAKQMARREKRTEETYQTITKDKKVRRRSDVLKEKKGKEREKSNNKKFSPFSL